MAMFLGRRLDDPDDRLLRWGWRAFAAWTVIGGARLWQSLGAGEEALVGVALAAPLWAAWLVWLLWRGAAALYSAAEQHAHRRWHGNYHEFDGRQIRILFDGGRILVAAADVFDAIGIDTRGREPERVRLLAGRTGLVELPGETPLFFTERGLAAWMERRAEVRAARFGRWFESEVAAPWRRRAVASAGRGEC